MLKTYNLDGRLPIEKLYDSYLKPKKKFGWVVDKIYKPRISPRLERGDRRSQGDGVPAFKQREFSLPILGLRTKKKGRAVWLIAGIHGEEPAGPIAIAENVDFLGCLGRKGIPIVILPLCNPSGYFRDWRYPNEYRDEERGTSVGDSSHLLSDIKNPTSPRTKNPACPEAEALTAYVAKLSKKYPPLSVIDFHEDEDKTRKDPYIYFQGKLGANDPLAQKVVKILLKNGFKLQMKGKTRFGEKIVNGVVSNITDSSLDELLGAKRIILDGKVIIGPSAQKVVVIETRIIGIPLKRRVKVQGEILRSVVPGAGFEPTKPYGACFTDRCD